MNTASLTAVARAIGKGVVVVRSTRLPSGFVARNVEVDDDVLGTIASGDLNPAKARVLLKLAPLRTAEIQSVQRLFDTH